VTADASPIRSVTAPAREVPLSELRAHPGNPRKISPARLEQLQRTLVAEREMLQARCDVIRQRYADYTGQPDLAP
jgi:hypothetical protein